MHIVTVVADMSLSAGTERAQVALCKELAKRGHSIGLIYNRDGWMLAEWREFVASINKVTIKPATWPALWNAVHRARNPQREAILYVHHSGHWTNLIVGAIGKYLGSMPLVVHMHLPYGGHYAIPRDILNRTSKILDAVIYVSNANRDIWLDAGICTANMYVIGNGIDVKKYHPSSKHGRDTARERFGIDTQKYVVLMLGRLNEEKGIFVLLEAWHKLMQRDVGRRLELLCIGKPSSRSVSEAIRTTKQAVLIPWMEDVTDAYNVADVVVVPSIWEEPSPLILLEAMAQQRQVIASSAGGIRETLGEWGELYAECIVPPGDSQGLADAIWRNWQAPSYLREQMAADARIFVERKRSLSGCAESVERVLGGLLMSQGKR